MNISKELEMAFANDFAKIKSVDVVYTTGKEISGFVSNARFIPLQITLCKHQTLRGENSNHFLDFSLAKSITLTYHDGTVSSFS